MTCNSTGSSQVMTIHLVTVQTYNPFPKSNYNPFLKLWMLQHHGSGLPYTTDCRDAATCPLPISHTRTHIRTHTQGLHRHWVCYASPSAPPDYVTDWSLTFWRSAQVASFSDAGEAVFITSCVLTYPTIPFAKAGGLPEHKIALLQVSIIHWTCFFQRGHKF